MEVKIGYVIFMVLFLSGQKSKNNVIYLKVSICEMCEAESKMIYIFLSNFMTLLSLIRCTGVYVG